MILIFSYLGRGVNNYRERRVWEYFCFSFVFNFLALYGYNIEGEFLEGSRVRGKVERSNLKVNFLMFF